MNTRQFRDLKSVPRARARRHRTQFSDLATLGRFRRDESLKASAELSEIRRRVGASRRFAEIFKRLGDRARGALQTRCTLSLFQQSAASKYVIKYSRAFYTLFAFALCPAVDHPSPGQNFPARFMSLVSSFSINYTTFVIRLCVRRRIFIIALVKRNK